MFHCGVGSHMSGRGEKKTVVVMEWRKKEYPAVELPKLFGDPHRRFSRGGNGFEAAVTVNACPGCATDALKSAPLPPKTNDYSLGSVAGKTVSVADDVPHALAFGHIGARFTIRLAANCYYPKGQITRVLDRAVEPNRESYLMIEEVRKKADDVKFVEVSFKIVRKPVEEAVA